MRLYYAEAGSASFSIRAGFDKDLRTLRDERAEKLVSVFEKGVKEGIFRKLDPYHMGPALHGIIDAFLFLMMENPDRFRNEDNLSDAADIFLRGVLSE